MDDLLRYHGADWVGFALTLASLYLLGSQRRGGFLLGAIASVAWAVFSKLAESPATLLANVVFCGLHIRGWLNWRAHPIHSGDTESGEG